MIPEDDDLGVTIPEQRQPVPVRPRIAPAEILFDRPDRNEHRDVLDALAALGHGVGRHC